MGSAMIYAMQPSDEKLVRQGAGSVIGYVEQPAAISHDDGG